MLTEQQLKEKIQRRELEVNFRNKGINLDSELQKELNYWWGILDKVLDRKIHYKKKSSDLEMKVGEEGIKIIQLMASRQGLDQKIINHKDKEQELNKKITNLESEIDDLNQLNKSLTIEFKQEAEKKAKEEALKAKEEEAKEALETALEAKEEAKQELDAKDAEFEEYKEEAFKEALVAQQTLERQLTAAKEEAVKATEEYSKQILAAKIDEKDNELATVNNKLNTTQGKLTNYKNYLQTILGTNNFNNLPNNNTGQSLADLITFYNNGNGCQSQINRINALLTDNNIKHSQLKKQLQDNRYIANTSHTWQDYLQNAPSQTDLNTRINNALAAIIQISIEAEKQNHQQTKTKLHAIPSNWQQQIAEANEAKKQIEKERDNCPTQQELDDWKLRNEQLENDYQSQLVKQEKQIISKLNSDLDLNFQEPNLEQVIARIQQLISKPPKEIYQEFNNGELEQELNQAKQTISRLEKELTPFGEDLAVIKELELTSLEQLFNQAIDSDIKQQITQATSYQQVVSARQAFIQQQLGERQNIAQVVNQPSQELNKPLNQEKVILISALVASLLSVGGLMMKLKNIGGSKRKR